MLLPARLHDAFRAAYRAAGDRVIDDALCARCSPRTYPERAGPGTCIWRREQPSVELEQRGNTVLQRRTTQDSEFVISYLALRKLVGLIGLLLPFVLMVGNVVMSRTRPDSMSGYYYTPMRNIFVGALCALGVFLVAYDGGDKVDRWITNVAGFCAIGVAFCPTKPSGPLATWQNVVGDVHVVFAASTFVALGVMALRFAKDGEGSQTAPRSDIITYRLCGIVIFACVVLAISSNFLPSAVFASWPVLFILEAIAVVAFGVSWIVKGTTMLGARLR
jgi:hypothetical protein